MSNSGAVVELAMYIMCVWTEVKRKWEGRKAIMKILSGLVPYCKRDQSNFEVGKRNIPKSTAPIIYKHNRDRELLAGASARREIQGNFRFVSSHTHKQAQAHTHTLTALLRNTLTHGQTHTYSQRHIHFQTQTCAFTFIHTGKLQSTDVGFVVKI